MQSSFVFGIFQVISLYSRLDDVHRVGRHPRNNSTDATSHKYHQQIVFTVPREIILSSLLVYSTLIRNYLVISSKDEK